MLHHVFNFLNKYLVETKEFDGVTIENSYISKNAEPDPANKIFITLLNIEEERTAKIPYQYKRNDAVKPSKFDLLNPVLNLNLYVMISGSGAYDEALKNISKVIACFANKNAFSSDEIDILLELEGGNAGKISELSLDIQNISLDQSNNLWQALANHILPHIIYKVRAIAIVPSIVHGTATEVREISLTANRL